MRYLVPEYIQTGRLNGERTTTSDLDEIMGLYGNADVMRTLSPDGKPWDRDRVMRFLARQEARWDRDGFGLWTFRLRATEEVIGHGGLLAFQKETLDGVEAAWAVVANHWREGFGSEIAESAIRLAWEFLDLDVLWSYTLPHNVASRRVMEKHGFTHHGQIENAGLPHVLYRLERERRGG